MGREELTAILRLLGRPQRRIAFWAGAGVVLGALEVATLGLLLLTVGVIVGNPQASGGRVDALMGLFPSRQAFLTAALVVLLLVAAFKYLFSLWVERRNNRIVFGVGADLQKTVYGNLLYAPFGLYHHHRHGTLTNAVMSVPFRAFQGVVFLPKALLSMATILFMSLFLLVLSPTVFMVAAVFAVAYFTAVRKLVQGVVFETNVQRHESLQRSAEVVSEAMSGIRQIRIFGSEERTLDEFGAEADRYAVNSAKETFIKLIPNATVQFLFVGVLAVVLLAANRTMSAAEFIALAPVFVTYVYGAMRIMPSVGQFNEAVLNMTASVPHVRALGEWLDMSPDPLAAKGAVRIDEIKRGITFKDVDFWFDEEQPVLHHLDLTIPAGKVTALIGPSGTGKSTVVDLMLKFIAPCEGSVLIDDTIDLRDVDRAEWFKLIGFVSQETFLFHATIRENLLYSNGQASDAELRSACERAGILDFVESLPQGMETMVGDRGVTLSGGQRQRFAIARALVRDPRILILDEATNALDAETEAQVVDTIFELAADRTVVMVAHKLSILERADQVVQLRAGRVANSGTYRELLNRGAISEERE